MVIRWIIKNVYLFVCRESSLFTETKIIIMIGNNFRPIFNNWLKPSK